MWKELKLKAFIKTLALTGECLPMNWSKYQAEPKDKPNVWDPEWGVIRDPLDGSTVDGGEKVWRLAGLAGR